MGRGRASSGALQMRFVSPRPTFRGLQDDQAQSALGFLQSLALLTSVTVAAAPMVQRSASRRFSWDGCRAAGNSEF